MEINLGDRGNGNLLQFFQFSISLSFSINNWFLLFHLVPAQIYCWKICNYMLTYILKIPIRYLLYKLCLPTPTFSFNICLFLLILPYSGAEWNQAATFCCFLCIVHYPRKIDMGERLPDENVRFMFIVPIYLSACWAFCLWHIRKTWQTLGADGSSRPPHWRGCACWNTRKRTTRTCK